MEIVQTFLTIIIFNGYGRLNRSVCGSVGLLSHLVLPRVSKVPLKYIDAVYRS